MTVLRFLPRAATVVFVLFAFASISNAKQAKDFVLPSATDDSLIRLSDYSGKVVLIHFWQTTCGWCQQETPKLAQLQEKYGDRGLRIIGVSCDGPDTVGDIPEFMEQYGVDFPVGLSDGAEFRRVVLPSGTVYTPHNFLVSRDGELESLGAVRDPEQDWRELEQAIERRLAEPVPQQPAIEPRTLRPAPEIDLEDLEGRKYSLTEFADEPMVVAFFTDGTGSWAGDVYTKLHEDYASQGLRVVGIHLFGEEDGIRNYIDKYDAQYPVLRGTRDVQREWIGSNSAWATFFVTADGRILKKWTRASTNGREGVVFPRYAEGLLEPKKIQPK